MAPTVRRLQRGNVTTDVPFHIKRNYRPQQQQKKLNKNHEGGRPARPRQGPRRRSRVEERSCRRAAGSLQRGGNEQAKHGAGGKKRGEGLQSSLKGSSQSEHVARVAARKDRTVSPNPGRRIGPEAGANVEAKTSFPDKRRLSLQSISPSLSLFSSSSLFLSCFCLLYCFFLVARGQRYTRLLAYRRAPLIYRHRFREPGSNFPRKWASANVKTTGRNRTEGRHCPRRRDRHSTGTATEKGVTATKEENGER